MKINREIAFAIISLTKKLRCSLIYSQYCIVQNKIDQMLTKSKSLKKDINHSAKLMDFVCICTRERDDS